MRDEVEYNVREGLKLPDQSNRNSTVPAVHTHTRYLGSNQPEMVIQYEYTTQNFLGFNGDYDEWSADRDYLYQTLTDYTYGSTETVTSGQETVTTERAYNSYHLMISEEVKRQNCTYRTEYTYHAKPYDSIEAQPAQFQLPKEKKEIFIDENKRTRTQITKTEFDTSGNPTKEISPDGTETRTTWYSANGENGCPAEPNGFVRFIKEQKTIPRRISGSEKEVSRKYTYTKLGNTNYVVQDTELGYHDGVLLDRRSTAYNSQQGGAEFGRITEIIDLLYDLNDRTKSYANIKRFTTEVKDGEMTQTIHFSGHDGLQTNSTRRQSIFNGRVYSDISSQGIETRYSYDAMGRLIHRTLCPGSAYEHSTTFEYGIDPQGPYSIETDPTGNKSKTRFDGAGRIINRQRFDADKSEWFKIFSKDHNSLGESVNSTVNDWLIGSSGKATNFPLSATTSFDGWGEMKSVAFSNGKTQHQQTDQINLIHTSYEQGNINNERLTSGSFINAYDTINGNLISKTLKTVSGEVHSTIQLTWDGLGQLLEEQDEMGAVTKRTYDECGRVITQTLPDGTIVRRTYAPHLGGNEIASISVTGSDASGRTRTWLLGTQTFDSLGRLKERVSGGRTTSYTYQGVSPKPSTVTMPSGKTLHYTYIPELDYAISSMTTDGITQTYSYDKGTGKLLSASESPSTIHYTWSKDGRLTEEMFSYNGTSKRSKHAQTLNEAPTSYTDVTGKETQYTMNSHGQVIRISDPNLTVDLTYDALGRLKTKSVRDQSSNSSLTTRLSYDDFGREIKRTIADGSGVTVELSQTFQINGLLATRSTKKNNVTIRDDHFGYDNRNRLVSYRATGNSLPTDAYGNQMTSQTYQFDALNNLTSVATTFNDRSSNTATYHYENQSDPTQLTKVNNTHSKYPANVNLSYDAEGRMTHDEAGRTLSYDAMGRLKSVIEKNGRTSIYGYDALSRLITQKIGDNDIRHLYYRGTELVNEIFVSKHRETRLIKSGHSCFGIIDGDHLTLTGADKNDSLLMSTNSKKDAGNAQLHAWSPYGNGETDSSLPGFNGERIDPSSGMYHLGNGYRAYNPVLMRFNCPDSLSPFGEGGINAYAYCAGDPINHTDPSGHLSWQAITGIVMSAIGIAFSVFTAGASIAAAGGVMAAIASASTTSLIVGGLGIVSDVTSIVSGAMEDTSPEASGILGWVSLATGIAGMAIGVAKGGTKALQTYRAARSEAKEGLRNLNDPNYVNQLRRMAQKHKMTDLDRLPQPRQAPRGTRQAADAWHREKVGNYFKIGSDVTINGNDVRKEIDKMIHLATPDNPIIILTGGHGNQLGLNYKMASNGKIVRDDRLLQTAFYAEDMAKCASQRVRVLDMHKIPFSQIARYIQGDHHVIMGFCFGRNDAALRYLLNLPPVTSFV
ncbi:uncharacterized protein LOC129572506 [Sitodiplosis mosellana]|uniref:uncharacterized protein LOC129572506 n=1 Tax=Sitodiplosis mosellana TaxID=263140 RepID=UPI002443E0B2|nr:uncharacterized protein LOC129572506 [Sitodiplosis mosellana]